MQRVDQRRERIPEEDAYTHAQTVEADETSGGHGNAETNEDWTLVKHVTVNGMQKLLKWLTVENLHKTKLGLPGWQGFVLQKVMEVDEQWYTTQVKIVAEIVMK